MKRVPVYLLGTAVVASAILVYLFFHPHVAARVLFAANSSPVEIALKNAYDVPEADEKTESIVAAAKIFLDSLDDDRRQAATYRFTDNAQRANWSNLPEGMAPRGGVKLGALSELQRASLDALLREFLSEDGVENVVWQLAAADMLIPNDVSGVMKLGSEYFYAAFLGEPSATEPWMFQFGGHHLAINATVFGPHISFSPMLTGGRPLHLRVDGDDVFITGREVAAAQALMDSLTDDRKERAVRAARPVDLVLGPGKYGATVAPEGIAGSALTAAQRTLLLDVIEARLGFMNDDDFAAKMKTVAAGIEDTHFGWWGPLGIPGAAYFRVTGPTFVLEYAPQSGRGAVDHAHSMYRDLDNDYGSMWIGAE